MRSLRLAAWIGFLTALAPAEAELWTNQAGRVVEATLRSVDGAWVTLVRTNGAPLRLPLSALCAADQRRVRLQTSQSVVPDFVQAAYQDARSVLDQFERLPARQQTIEGRKRATHLACLAFDARLKDRAAELQDPAVRNEVQRLRALLASPPKE